ncbi:MAG: 4-hydroxy-tetrahydrodipicolinate reductase [Bacteroidetes bacterium QS_8_68_15]|nr:MAG: 4-hydroxy-tetrahydrodipicolinate reductase [Bacteroidetes bacterium QS_8_68_15]
MTLALVGTGQMGQAVARQAERDGHDVVARFDSSRPLAEASGPDALDGADVAVDFSLPVEVLDHIERYCRWQQPAVVGTTGWYDEIGAVEAWTHEHDARLLYAPNFSIGVALLRTALEAVAPMLDGLDEYDAFVHEMHHTKKADSPSGTARMLGEVLLDHLARKGHLDTEAQHGPIDAEALHISSTRAGTVFGRHTVGLDSPFDQVRLEHEAKSREGFAAGAVRAARWLSEQSGRSGLFTLEDALREV